MATVEIAQRCLDEDFSDLPERVRLGILKKLEILANHAEYGKPLAQELAGKRRIIYGQHMIVYRYHEQSDSVFVMLVRPRMAHDMEGVYTWLSERLHVERAEGPAAADFSRLLEVIVKQGEMQKEPKRGGA